MRLISGPDTWRLPNETDAIRIVLFGPPRAKGQGRAGASLKSDLLSRGFDVAPRAWDLLSIALSVTAADFAASRRRSADGWTRELELDVAVQDPHFWQGQAPLLEDALAFLTTDRWHLTFHDGGITLPTPAKAIRPTEDCAVLVSGGLDSLVGVIDLAASGRRPIAISQTVRGDAHKQIEFVGEAGSGLSHVQLNHNVRVPGPREASQRARSLIFISFGVMAATALLRYHEGGSIPLYICENGFIAINPPLTDARLGSLSTRTTHPAYLGRLQQVLDSAGLRITLSNPYGDRTKGEMLEECANQSLLRSLATRSTSCGRFQRFKYRHCGRCVPCQVRRAALRRWGHFDSSEYVFQDLGRNDREHAAYDDVRSVAMALSSVAADGMEAWVGPSLSSPFIANRQTLIDMLERGLDELRSLHDAYSVR